MEADYSPNSFIFNDKIDPGCLQSLYENDFPYIEEIFKTILDNYDSDLAAIRKNFSGKNLEGLRKAVHKIKPAFGFIGMTGIQEICLRFEQDCSKAVGTDELSDQLNKLLLTLEECKVDIRQDYDKLVTYNKNRT